MNKVITIGRQYGSGGREIGQKVAEYYGIPFYDNELITRASEREWFCRGKFCKSRGSSDKQSVIFSCNGDQCVWQSGFWIQWIIVG